MATTKKAAPQPKTIEQMVDDAVVMVAPEGRIKRDGYKVVCPGCAWESYRYDQRSTAELIFVSHAQRCGGLRIG